MSTTLILKNARLAFPDLFEAKQFDGKGPFTYGATFLMAPDSAEKVAVEAAMKEAADAKWGAKATEVLKAIRAGGSQKCCFVSGDSKTYDGFAGNWSLSAKRQQDSGHPKIVVYNPTSKEFDDLSPSDGKPYAGCYVTGKVEIWAQDNSFGKAIRATLIAVQFTKDGDAFSATGPADVGGLEAVEDDGADLA
ncbi:MAG: DUF2815 family protein [Nitrospirales bacterium]|nr:DUF2815 family protein [Nitrospirales bacterium]